jgi:rhamnosyl/mannosyltransferase
VNVAIVSPYDPRPGELDDPDALCGGVEAALDRCASGLARRGHEVTLVTSAAEAGERVDPDGVRVVRVRRRGTIFRAPVAPLHAAVPRDAEVVHVPATYPLVSDLIPMREARRGRRGWGQRATVLDHHFDVRGTSVAMRAAAAAHARTLGRGMARATRVLAKSLDYARSSPWLSRVPRDRLDWVPNGVDVDAFPLKRGEGEGLLCVGRLVPYKGVDVLLRAMPSVHERTGATLTIAGDGPERARLERSAPSCVRFVGRLPREALARAYADARVTVLPSVNAQEAFGIALLESMAAGTPVVASDLPGVREVARLAGLTAPPRDAAALADAVVRALEAPRTFGAPAEIRARVRDAYGSSLVLDRLEASYRRALADVAARAGHSRAPSPRRRTGAAG